MHHPLDGIQQTWAFLNIYLYPVRLLVVQSMIQSGSSLNNNKCWNIFSRPWNLLKMFIRQFESNKLYYSCFEEYNKSILNRITSVHNWMKMPIQSLYIFIYILNVWIKILLLCRTAVICDSSQIQTIGLHWLVNF